MEPFSFQSRRSEGARIFIKTSLGLVNSYGNRPQSATSVEKLREEKKNVVTLLTVIGRVKKGKAHYEINSRLRGESLNLVILTENVKFLGLHWDRVY